MSTKEKRPPPPVDTREAQAERVADFLEAHPEGATLAEINAACDLGSGTKVLSDMRRELGYRVPRGPGRWVATRCGSRRHVATYVLASRPRKAQLDLFA